MAGKEDAEQVRAGRPFYQAVPFAPQERQKHDHGEICRWSWAGRSVLRIPRASVALAVSINRNTASMCGSGRCSPCRR